MLKQNPKNKEYIQNLVIAGAFVGLGLCLPGASLIANPTAFMSNMTGIATGIGIGWFIKTFIDQKKSGLATKAASASAAT